MDRRQFLSLSSLGAAAVLLTACSGPSLGGGTGASTAPVGGPDFTGVTPAKKITFWSNHPGSSQDVTQQIIQAFTAKTGIEVELVTAGKNYEEVAQKFQTAQQGGTLPDIVVFSDVWWFRYYLQDSIIPLGNALKAADVDAAGYRPGLFNDYAYKGEQWAVPWARSTPLFYYNKAHWQQAGLPDRAPETWEEFAQWAPKLTAATGLPAYEHPALADYAGWTLQNILWGYGGGWSKSDSFDLTTDSDASVKALQYVQDSVYTGKWATVASKSGSDDLAAGATSSTLSSTGSLVGVQKAVAGKFDVGVGFLPGGPEAKTNVCPTGGAGVGIPKGISKENQLAAAQFIGFLTNAENTVTFSGATGYLPVQNDADTASLLQKNPLIGTAIKQLDVTHTQDWARVFLPGADQEIAKSVASIVTQQADVKSTLTALQSTLEGIYTSQVKPKLS
ncbi:ABC transporter substrate-binding protein [uncultured Microbacterium sp.]|uniref:ABC transporter substrate-binding protein n=1 Tax=uncultured Microbacterium sp. TaxID=191216 RepID=UPI0025E6C2CD|nr:ABC transporter substrate-binding protein [uncultured Microbacterium sp.]